MEFQGFVIRALVGCLPCKISAILVVNQPFLFGSVIWPIMSQLMSAKLKSRVVVIGKDYESLDGHVGKPCVPTSCGGTRELDGQLQFERLCEDAAQKLRES